MAILRAIQRTGARAVVGFALGLSLAAAPASAQQCMGDCDGSNTVEIDELITGVNAALGSQSVSVCPSFDCRHTGTVPIDCLIQAVDNALHGCGLPTPTATPVPTAPTTTPACPLSPGRYTITQTTGGTLRIATFASFEFPAGGTLIQDVGAGDANCVHDTVVPFPGGFNIPVFCIPALGASTAVTQTGCGVGRIDSDGGSDFTITEDGDTSETRVCNVHQATCPAAAPDSSGRLDVTVGDGNTDTCSSGGTANAVVTVPVRTVTWIAADASCPDTDGTFTPGTDTKLLEFPQTLDLTTDSNTARFTDLDGDSCSKSGLGPTGPFSNTGVCIDLDAMTVTTADSGAIFSSGGPTYDVLFTTQAPNTISGPTPSGGATCASPPEINFSGLQSRCSNAP